MTLLTFKKYQEFVNEELEQFYEEAENSQKNYKIPVDLKKNDYSYDGSSFDINKVKKKERIKKIKKTWVKNNKTKNLF
jgi:hypothetical protein